MNPNEFIPKKRMFLDAASSLGYLFKFDEMPESRGYWMCVYAYLIHKGEYDMGPKFHEEIRMYEQDMLHDLHTAPQTLTEPYLYAVYHALRQPPCTQQSMDNIERAIKESAQYEEREDGKLLMQSASGVRLDALKQAHALAAEKYRQQRAKENEWYESRRLNLEHKARRINQRIVVAPHPGAVVYVDPQIDAEHLRVEEQ